MPTNLSQEVVRAARALWSFHLVYDEPAPADVIIGLGSYDIRVAQKCIELHRKGYSSRILFTGGSGNWTREFFKRPEADIFAEIAIAAGVPSSEISIERYATNIGENLIFSRRTFPDFSSAILVTKPQTQRRVLATKLLLWPDVHAIITAPPTDFADQPTSNHTSGMLIEEMVGDLARLIEYPALGYCAPMSIPREAMEAFRILLAHGYTGHLPN